MFHFDSVLFTVETSGETVLTSNEDHYVRVGGRVCRLSALGHVFCATTLQTAA